MAFSPGARENTPGFNAWGAVMDHPLEHNINSTVAGSGSTVILVLHQAFLAMARTPPRRQLSMSRGLGA
jgi:hypothetical protein